MKLMSGVQYAAKGGCVCPVCGADDISGESVEIDAGYAYQEVGCDNCGASWTDVYKLVGYDHLEVDAEAEEEED